MKRTTDFVLGVGACVVTLLFFSFSRMAPAQDLTAAKVRQSIDRAAKFMLGEQAADGSWQGSMDMQYREGVTSLATLALLNSGVPPNHPGMKKAIARIAQLPQDQLTTYVASLRIMVLTTADPKGQLYRPEIQNDVDWLIAKQVSSGPNEGGWHYPSSGKSADASNTQFAMLGLHEGKRVGARIPVQVWKRAIKYWNSSFNRGSGGFTYIIDGRAPIGSMTCAGIASLIIAEENLADISNLVDGGEVACCQPNSRSELIELGLDWMAREFSVRSNPRQGGLNGAKFYYLYGMERVGRLSGRRFFGAHDWYREGAEHLLKLQKSNGSWVGGGYSENSPPIATSFALLFLAKGKRPIAIGKLKYGTTDDWDRHPLGVHYLTRELETQWKANLNWQTIDGDGADVRDLAETPVLFISGRDQLDLAASQKQALKEYVENGNFIFAEAGQGNGCGENVAFDRRFRALMAELYPDSSLEPLSASHPIWNAHFEVTPNPEWVVYGLQACCRTSVVYCPRSLSGHWQLNLPAMLEQLPEKAKTQVSYATELGVNVVSYATGRQLRDKLDLPDVGAKAVSVLANRSLVLPKLMHRGGADDAPNAWRNVLRRANEIGLEVDMEKRLIAAQPDLLADHPFVFLHGRSRLRFTDPEREALASFLDGGHRGFLFADSICSSPEFTKDFEYEIRQILPSAELKEIPADHPMWSESFGGFKLDSVTITKPDRTRPDGFLKRLGPPIFKGVEIEGRLVIVFSPYDLSCALENASVSNCEGYTRQDAVRLALNVLLYRLHSD